MELPLPHVRGGARRERGHDRARNRRWPIRGDEGPWFLVNASPDARQQLEGLTSPAQLNGVRVGAGQRACSSPTPRSTTPPGCCSCASRPAPVRVYSATRPSDDALRSGFPVLAVLERYSGVEWHTLEPEQRDASWQGRASWSSSFRVGRRRTALPERGRASSFRRSGCVFRDRTGGGVVTYVPGLARLDDGVLNRFAASRPRARRRDLLARRRARPCSAYLTRSARDMGHVPLSGARRDARGARSGWSGHARRWSTSTTPNPILLEDSPERADGPAGAGVEVAYDGLEIEL